MPVTASSVMNGIARIDHEMMNSLFLVLTRAKERFFEEYAPATARTIAKITATTGL